MFGQEWKKGLTGLWVRGEKCWKKDENRAWIFVYLAENE